MWRLCSPLPSLTVCAASCPAPACHALAPWLMSLLAGGGWQGVVKMPPLYQRHASSTRK